jgi:hypothetical protein
MSDELSAACESPRDCKHGRLARSCEICELERDSELLHKGCLIEIAVRNASVAEHMRHWEDRATKAERERNEAADALERVTREGVEARMSYTDTLLRLQASEQRAQADRAEVERLRAELENIANAKRFDRTCFDDDTSFADWAQSRARFTLEHK